MPPPPLTPLLFARAADWEAWLAAHHGAHDSVWLRFAKKAAALESLTYHEALEAALCYGWIDGQARSWDADSWIQRFGPRRPRSIWSKLNRRRALALIKAGRMQPAGQREIDRAKKDGRWAAAYDSPKNAAVPADLRAALDANPAARDFFPKLTATNRYAILHRLQTAKKPETRARRLDQFVAMLAREETLHPQKL